MSDEVRELVRRSLRGDQSAMADLVDQFRGQVFGLCYRMLGHRQDAEDVTQEAFARALRSLANWDDRREFTPWLLAIAGNRCRSLQAVRVRRPKLVDEFDALPDRAADRQQARNLAEEVELALERLRQDHREAFVLFHEHQLSYAEIAETLNCPVGTVKTWVHRARRELADHLRRRGVVQESPDALRRI